MHPTDQFVLIFVAVSSVAAGFLVIYEVSKADLKSVRENRRHNAWAALLLGLFAALCTLNPLHSGR